MQSSSNGDIVPEHKRIIGKKGNNSNSGAITLLHTSRYSAGLDAEESVSLAKFIINALEEELT